MSKKYITLDDGFLNTIKEGTIVEIIAEKKFGTKSIKDESGNIDLVCFDAIKEHQAL